jgi:translocation and assembly module TamB
VPAATRRALRIGGKVAFAVLAVVLLAIGGLWTFAQSARGGDLIRRIALRQVNARIAGTLQIDRLRFGGNRLTLGGVSLEDPDGGVVARVSGVDLRFAPLALLRGRFEIDRLEIDRPDLRLTSSARGSNLSRAVAGRAPQPPGPEPGPSSPNGGPGLEIDLRQLAVRDGNVSIRSGAPPVRIRDLDVDGRARYETGSQLVRVDLRVAATGARIEARGSLDPGALRAGADGFRVRLHDVNLADLVRDTPRSNLAINLDAAGRDATLDLRFRAPGLAIDGNATYDGTDVDARLGIDATDLAATARNLARCHLAPPIELTGAGKVDVRARGPATRPALEVTARVPHATFQDYGARDLNADLRVPRLDKPQEIKLDLTATDLRLQDRHIAGLSVALHVIGPRVAANVRAARPYPLALAAHGFRLTPHAIRLDDLTLRYPGESWTLAGPTRLLIDGDRVELSGLDLRGRGQRMRADFSKDGRSGRARVGLSHFDLARLPQPLVPHTVAALGKIDLQADLRFSPSRLRGRISGRAVGTGVDADLDLPASWPPRDPRQRVHLALKVPETDLGALAKTVETLTGQPVPIATRGKVTLSAHIEGRSANPRVQVTARARGLAIAGEPIGTLDLTVDGEGDRPIALRLHTGGAAGGVLAGPLTVTAQTDESVRALLRRPMTAERVARLPFQAKLEAPRIALAAAGKLSPRASGLGGFIAVHATARGTPERPEGTLALDLAGVTGGRIPATDGRVEVSLDQRATQVNVRLLRAQHALLALEARAQAGLDALASRAAWAEIPIRVRAVVGPLAVTHLGLARPDEPGLRQSELRGRLHADLAIDGTMHAPRLLAHAQADQLQLDRTPIGYGRLEARYENDQARVGVTIFSANGGTLAVNAGVRANLGLPDLLERPPDLRRLAFDLTVKAQELDLKCLSGMSAMLPRAGGLLNADLQARGELGDPRFSGHVECKQCEVDLEGMGSFRDVHLALHADTNKVVLDELTAKSGAGHARVTAALSRKADHGAYDLSGTIDATSMPIYQEGQPLATLTVAASLSGTTGGGKHARATVDVREAKIQLSDEKRKDLQSLKPAGDVVIVRNGRPIDRRQAKRLRELDVKLGLAAAPAEKDGAGAGAGDQAGRNDPWSSLTIVVNAPHKLWVSGHDAHLELGLGQNFRVRVDRETQIYGEVVVRRGRINALGRRLDLKADSMLEFGGPPDRPILDATAQYHNTQENVTVLVNAKGPLDHLDISVSSPNRPDLTRAQLFALIITGHLESTTSSGGAQTAGSMAANEASSLIAGAIAGGLQKTLAKRLPLDVLTIDAGSAGLTGTQFEAGRYLTDRLYVGYVGRIGADPTRYQNRNAVHIEYQLGARWQFAGEYGDVGTGSADLMWKKSY